MKKINKPGNFQLCTVVFKTIINSHTASSLSKFKGVTTKIKASFIVQSVKNLPTMQETQVWLPGQEEPLEKEMATDSSSIAWRIPWTEEPSGLQSMGLQESDNPEWLSTHIQKSTERGFPCLLKKEKKARQHYFMDKIQQALWKRLGLILPGWDRIHNQDLKSGKF